MSSNANIGGDGGEPSGELLELGMAGVEIGHWSDLEARTGCTVIVLPPGTVASGEVRGGAPATRDFALLAPERMVEHVDAIVLTGGSAFGLAACDGVMTALEAEGRGFETAHGRVPIVVAMALYDLGVGSAARRPDADAGRLATSQRATASVMGAVGAGTGATTGKWLGADKARPGGLGVAVVRSGELVVCAVVAVNAAGSPDDSGGRSILAQAIDGLLELPPPRVGPFAHGETITQAANTVGSRQHAPSGSFSQDETASGVGVVGAWGAGAPSGSFSQDETVARAPTSAESPGMHPLENTTLCAVITNAALSKLECFWVSQGGHDGLARSLVPAHTRHDGDAVVAAATGEVHCDVDAARLLAVAAVTQAVSRAVARRQ